MNDTHPKIEKIVRELMAQKSGVERLKMGCSMYDAAKQMVVTSLPIQTTGDENLLKMGIFLRFYKDDFNSIQRNKILNHLTRDNPDGSTTWKVK